MRRLAHCFIGLSLDAYFSRDTEKRVIDLKLLQVQSTIALEKNYVFPRTKATSKRSGMKKDHHECNTTVIIVRLCSNNN